MGPTIALVLAADKKAEDPHNGVGETIQYQMPHYWRGRLRRPGTGFSAVSG